MERRHKSICLNEPHKRELEIFFQPNNQKLGKLQTPISSENWFRTDETFKVVTISSQSLIGRDVFPSPGQFCSNELFRQKPLFLCNNSMFNQKFNCLIIFQVLLNELESKLHVEITNFAEKYSFKHQKSPRAPIN